jgi:hypothetical protein
MKAPLQVSSQGCERRLLYLLMHLISDKQPLIVSRSAGPSTA